MPTHRRALRTAGRLRACRSATAATLAIFVLIFQPGCFFKKGKVEEPQIRTPVRIVLLPLNVPSDQSELRWLSTAMPVLIAEAIQNSPDLEIVPLWESLPIAVEALGSSRTMTTETAAYVASRLSARWATQGEVGPDESGVSMLIDFVPSKATVVAFRYEKKGQLQSTGNHVREACQQFLRYLVARPLDENARMPEPAAVRQVAEAIDREYGWFVPAEPGKSGSVVSTLGQTDKQLAGLLFNPNLYPGIGTKPANNPAQQEKTAQPAPQPANVPGPAVVQPQPSPTVSPPKSEPKPPAAPEPQAAVQDEDFVLPPPKSFTQKVESSSVSRASEPKPAPARPVPAGGEQLPAQKLPAGEQLAAEKINASSPPSRPSAAGIRVQVLSSRNRQEAEALAELLKGRGLKPTIEEVDLREKGIWFRIRLHGYATRSEASEAVQKLVDEGAIKDFWIVP